jgi:hypothetical protein
MEWIYKRIWELKSKALTLENKARIQMLQQMLDVENKSTSNDSTAIASEKLDKNNSANNSSKDSSNKSKEEEEIHNFLFNRYNR